MHTLYTFRRCPYAIRARMSLALSGIRTKQIEVDLKNKPAKMLEYSPKGTVPVLILDNGVVIDESLDIMNWAFAQSMPKGWRVLSDAQKHHGDMWLEKLHNVFIPALNRYKYASRYEDVDIELEYAVLWNFLQEVNHALADSRGICIDSESYYDLAIFPFCRQAMIANPAWLEDENLSNMLTWYQAWVDHTVFKQVMAVDK